MANKNSILRLTTIAITAIVATFFSQAHYKIDWEASTIANVGTGDFAPYYISSNTFGIITQPISIIERGRIFRELKTTNRFEYGFGADIIANWSKSTIYDKYSPEQADFTSNKQHPSNIFFQQLWGGVKYRGIFLTAGMKENDRSIFNNTLGSGDIVEGTNSRPIPQVRIGFINFQNIPFTNGWVQIQGEIAYGKSIDSKWLENHYNYFNSFITTGWWYHYKRCYFRTNPHMPFSITVGMQHAAQFGGYYRQYDNGQIASEQKYGVGFKDFIDVFVQKQGGNGENAGDQAYYNGNHLGSWDLKLRYRFNNSAELTAYMQSPWEDGSAIGKLNGWDGVWGLEYKAAQPGIISSAIVEYIDFTNQSGPIHWSPSDRPGTPITGKATGADDYYNNYMYNGWTHLGMSIGSPFIKSTIYNTDGYLRFTDNRVRGVHIGVAGQISSPLSYKVLFSHRTSWGTPFIPNPYKLHDTSMMLEANYIFSSIPGLSVKGQIAFNAGSLYGDTFGALVSLTYSGEIILGKDTK